MIDNELLAKIVTLNGVPLKPCLLDTYPAKTPKYTQKLLFLFNGKIYEVIAEVEWKEIEHPAGKGMFEYCSHKIKSCKLA